MRSLGLFPVNFSTPTHITQSSSTLLDIFYVNDKSKILIFDQLSVPNFSKHDLIFTTFDFKVTCNTVFYSYRDFMHIDYDQLGEAVDAIPWKSIYSLVSTNKQFAFLQTNITALFDQYVPLVTKSKNAPNHHWFNSYIKGLIYKRNMAYHKWKRSKCEITYNVFKTHRREVSRTIKQQKLKYYEHQFSTAIGSKKTWKCIREIGIGNKCNHVCDYINGNDIVYVLPSMRSDA